MFLNLGSPGESFRQPGLSRPRKGLNSNHWLCPLCPSPTQPPPTHTNTPLSAYWPMQKTIDGSTRPCPDALSRKAFCLHLFLGQDASIVPILHPGGPAVPAVVTMATQQRGRTASSKALGTADYISLLDIPSFGPPQTPFLYLR